MSAGELLIPPESPGKGRSFHPKPAVGSRAKGSPVRAPSCASGLEKGTVVTGSCGVVLLQAPEVRGQVVPSRDTGDG